MRLLFSLVPGLLFLNPSLAQSASGVPQEVTRQTFEQPDKLLLYDQERLATYDIEELLYCQTSDAAIVQGENGIDRSYVADVREELIRRRGIERLISQLENAKGPWYQQLIFFVLFHIQDARVRRAFGNYDPSNTDRITYDSVIIWPSLEIYKPSRCLMTITGNTQCLQFSGLIV